MWQQQAPKRVCLSAASDGMRLIARSKVNGPDRFGCWSNSTRAALNAVVTINAQYMLYLIHESDYQQASS
jgi:hypothetical protein